MFDLGWSEMALIAIVAIVVIGPKELPKVMREIGHWVARARSLSRAFMDQLDEMSRQSGVEEMRKEMDAARNLNPLRQIEQTIDPQGVIKRETATIVDDANSTSVTAIPAPHPAPPRESPPAMPSPRPTMPDTASSPMDTPPTATPPIAAGVGTGSVTPGDKAP